MVNFFPAGSAIIRAILAEFSRSRLVSCSRDARSKSEAARIAFSGRSEMSAGVFRAEKDDELEISVDMAAPVRDGLVVTQAAGESNLDRGWIAFLVKNGQSRGGFRQKPARHRSSPRSTATGCKNWPGSPAKRQWKNTGNSVN